MATDNTAEGLAVIAPGKSRNPMLLRSAAAQAAIANPITSPYWFAPPAWAGLTNWYYGNVCSNGGNWYCCVTQGTSAASGGPSGLANANVITDGTVGWTYIGGAQAPYTADGAPTVTFVTTDPNLGTDWYPSAQPGVYHIRGANHAPYNAAYWKFQTVQQQAAGPINCCGASVITEVTDAKVAIYMPQFSNSRVLIDDRYIQPGTYYANANSWLVIDWTGTTGYRPHTYEVESNYVASIYGGVETTSKGYVGAPYLPSEIRSAWIIDSFGAGTAYGSYRGGAQIPQQMSKLLGWRDNWTLGMGGRGYQAQGAGNAYYTFGQSVPQALALNPNVFVFFGSVNDPINSFSAASTGAAALAAYQAIRAKSSAPIIVFGLPSISTAGVPAGTIATENAIAAAVASMNDPTIFFIPISTAPVPWALGSWNNTGLGVGVTDPSNAGYVIAQDNVHPPEFGQDFYSRRCADEIKRLVLPYL